MDTYSWATGDYGQNEDSVLWWIVNILGREFPSKGFNCDAEPSYYGWDIMRSDYASQGPVKEDCVCIAGGRLGFTARMLSH